MLTIVFRNMTRTPVISSFVSSSALESIILGALWSIGSFCPFVGEIGMEPFVGF
jgi:hypothetical protein